MVKGIAKQAVIVHPAEKSGFEQAIFILAPEQEGKKIATPEEMLSMADSIASKYTISSMPAIKKRKVMPYLIAFVLGACLTAACFLLLPMLMV